ncbi:glycoside hydrolase family 18 protein [Lacrimispora saccharolytica]|nr:glycosyl hydrolase family 18 protein [Lacrimispora saccharolytica]
MIYKYFYCHKSISFYSFYSILLLYLYNVTKKIRKIMIIHVVTPGETLQSIANQYGISPSLIISENELPNPENLVVGQSLAIRIPELIHIVKEGETLNSIAANYGVTVTQLWQNNPTTAILRYLIPGEVIIIRFQGEKKIDDVIMNGYAYTFIDRTVLRKTLPFLTNLLIFNYGFTPEGILIPTEDEELIQIANEYGVSPIMVLAPMNEAGVFNSQLASEMFENEAGENELIENLVAALRAKGYRGVDIDFEFILPEDKEAFLSFIKKVHTRLSQEGFLTTVALAPKTSGTMTGLLYEAHNYATLGAVADEVLLMTYEWGYTFGPPMATAPINNVRRVLKYGISVIDPDKILLGIPNYAYDWPLPFVRGTTEAESISNQQAIERAALFNVSILFDELAQSPYYYYTDYNDIEHVVWFDDVRSMNQKLRLIPQYGLIGGGVWQIMKFFPGLWNVVGSIFRVKKTE